MHQVANSCWSPVKLLEGFTLLSFQLSCGFNGFFLISKYLIGGKGEEYHKERTALLPFQLPFLCPVFGTFSLSRLLTLRNPFWSRHRDWELWRDHIVTGLFEAEAFCKKGGEFSLVRVRQDGMEGGQSSWSPEGPSPLGLNACLCSKEQMGAEKRRKEGWGLNSALTGSPAHRAYYPWLPVFYFLLPWRWD